MRKIGVKFFDANNNLVKSMKLSFGGAFAYFSAMQLLYYKNQNVWLCALKYIKRAFRQHNNSLSAIQLMTYMSLNREYNVVFCRLFKHQKNPYIYKLFTSPTRHQNKIVSFNISEKSSSLMRNKRLVKTSYPYIGYSDMLFTSTFDFSSKILSLYDPIPHDCENQEDVSDVIFKFYEKLKEDLLKIKCKEINVLSKRFFVFESEEMVVGLDKELLNRTLSKDELANYISNQQTFSDDNEELFILNGIFVQIKTRII